MLYILYLQFHGITSIGKNLVTKTDDIYKSCLRYCRNLKLQFKKGHINCACHFYSSYSPFV